MSFSFDFYNNLKQSKMFLANPQKNYIGTVINAQNIKLKQVLNNLFELDFILYEKVNGEFTENYNKYVKPRLIEVQNLGWFQIVEASEKFDDSSQETYKAVKCLMLENALIYRKIHNISGTFGLYDVTDIEHSLLHIISKEVKWDIGHVSNSLLTKFRTFNIDSMEIYNFLTTKVAESFECLITFDSYNKRINAYTLDEIGDDTNIVISRKNILREWEKSDDDAIVTKLRVYGGDDGMGGNIDIRAVNFGLNYLVNFDYFMSDEWVSVGLKNGYNNYKTALDNIQTSYNTTLNSLKTKLSELTVLKAELTDLISLQSAQSQVMGVSIQSHNGRVPVPSDSDYTIYQNAVTSYNTYTSQIATKKSQISSKEAEVKTLENSLDNISDSVDISNYLTSEQLSELDLFIAEGDDFSDETFVITDIMSPQEAIDVKLELKQSAANKLVKISQPRYTLTIKASNLYSIQDDKDSLISYNEWVEQLKLGNKILIKLRDDYSIIARLMSITVNFDNLSDIELTFTNKDSLEDSFSELAEIIAGAGRTANAYTLKSLGYDKASKITSPIREFINGTLNATKNAFVTNDNQDILIDEWGLRGRKWLESQNKYDDRQLWLNNNGMLLSSDGFKTAQLAIGLLTAPDGEQYYGIATDVLVGNLIIGEKLRLTGSGAELDLSANDSILGLSASITANINGLRTEFNQTLNNYSTTDEISSLINQFGDSLLDDISSNYATKIELSSSISQSASEILTAVSANYSTNTSVNNLTTRVSSAESSISQLATEITTKVSATNYNGETIVSMINQSSSKILMSALDIDLSGYVTFTNLSTAGQTTIDGANLKTGTVVADTVRSSWVYAGSINANQITAGTLNTGVIYTGSINANQITAGTISGDRIRGGTIEGVTIKSTGIEISGNNIKLTREFGSIVDSSGQTLIYAASSGGIIIGDSDNDPSVVINTNSFDMVTNLNSGIITLGIFNGGYLKLTGTKTTLSSCPISGTTSISGSTVNFIGNTIYLTGSNDIVFRKSSSDSGVSIFSLGTPNKLYSGNTTNPSEDYTVSFNTSCELIPNISSSSSTTCSLGSSSYAWKYLYIKNIYHISKGVLGFFGKTPVSQQTVSKLSTSADLTTVISKINSLLDALGNSSGYGIIKL